MDILKTRQFPPRKEGAVIARDASAELLSKARSCRLVIVKAPAGYGKTTLMVECYRSLALDAHKACWLSLAEFDGSVEELAGYLADALNDQGLTVGWPPRVAGGLPENFVPERVAALFSNALRSAAQPVCVFLDDLHAISRTPAEALLGHLVRDAPEHVHWIAGSRVAPAFALARLRALGQLAEFDVDDLRFSVQETRSLLALADERAVSTAVAELAQTRTEGWPAGLQLVSIAIRRRHDEEAFLARFSGEHRDVAAFLSEDVFERLDPAIQSFLLYTCILSRFCPSLCDALTEGSDGRQRLDDLESLSLFVFSLDTRRHWYRYHHLFADYLQGRLRERHPGLECELHRRASRWFAANDLMREAIEHALASGDHALAASLLDAGWEHLNRQGIFSTSVRWAASIPDGVLDNFPGIQLWRALHLTCGRRFAEARSILDGVQARLNRMHDDPACERSRLTAWRKMLKHREMVYATFVDDLPAVERMCEELIATPAVDSGFLDGTTRISLVVARHNQFKLADVEALVADARASCTRLGNEQVMIWDRCVSGPALVQCGEVDAAIDGYRQAIDLASHAVTDSDPLVAMSMLLLASLLVERYSLDEARELFARAAALGNDVGMVDVLVASYVGRARLAAHDGDDARAHALLREGFGVAVAQDLPRLRWHVVSERIRQALAHHDLAKAEQFASDAGLSADAAELRPCGQVTTRHEAMLMCWARLAIASGRHAQALRLLNAWIHFAERHAAVTLRVRLEILASRAHRAAGDGRAALRSIQQALALASATGMYFSFIEEGEPIRSLVAQALELREVSDSSAAFAAQLKAAFCAAPAPASASNATRPAASGLAATDSPTEPLTAREIDVLRCASRNMLNKEIGDRLGLTEGSVKWYLQQIYGKLGVRRRVGALEKARTLGYLR